MSIIISFIGPSRSHLAPILLPSRSHRSCDLADFFDVTDGGDSFYFDFGAERQGAHLEAQWVENRDAKAVDFSALPLPHLWLTLYEIDAIIM